jgi:hypothetical protein
MGALALQMSYGVALRRKEKGNPTRGFIRRRIALLSLALVYTSFSS